VNSVPRDEGERANTPPLSNQSLTHTSKYMGRTGNREATKTSLFSFFPFVGTIAPLPMVMMNPTRPGPQEVHFFHSYAQEFREAFRQGLFSEFTRLRQPHFVVWKAVRASDGTLHKPPYSPISHRLADTGNPASWGTWDQERMDTIACSSGGGSHPVTKYNQATFLGLSMPAEQVLSRICFLNALSRPPHRERSER
jgi:hypothetical protein